MSHSVIGVALRSHREGFGEEGVEYLGAGCGVCEGEELHEWQLEEKGSVNMLLCGTI